MQSLIPTEGRAPIEGTGEWGVGLTNDEKNAVDTQKAEIKFEMVGGNSTTNAAE